MSLVIKNGRVIDPASRTDRIADVLIVDGRVAGIAPDLSSPKAEVFDATGLIVAPGFIDMHVHLRDESRGRGGDLRRWHAGDERARDAPRNGVRPQLRRPGDPALRGSAPERRRRYA